MVSETVNPNGVQVCSLRSEATPGLSWLTDPLPIEDDKRLEKFRKEEATKGNGEDEGFGQWAEDLERKHPLANPAAWEDFKKCSDVDGLYKWAAAYNIKWRSYPKLLFARLCHYGQPFSVLLNALEDANLGTPGNFNFLLDWQVRHRTAKRRGGRLTILEPDDVTLLQQWMKRQLHLGLKREEDIFVYLRFISRIGDESVKSDLIASFEGLLSSSVFGFGDLGPKARSRVLEAISQRPVTRQWLKLGFSLIEATRSVDLGIRQPWKVTDQKIAAFFRRVIIAHASRPEGEKRDIRSLEVMSTILETIWTLPRELARLVVLKITKGLIHDHEQMPDSGPVTTRLRDLWISALGNSGGTFYQKAKIEKFLGTQKLAVIAPYFQQLNERKKASFALRYYVGPRSPSSQSQVQYFFRAFCYGKRKDSPWLSMLQATQEYARKSRRSGVDVGQLLRMLQVLSQPKTIVEIIKQARRLDTMIHQNDVLHVFRNYLGTQPRLAKLMIKFYPDSLLERCPELAERLILTPTISPEWGLEYVKKHYTRFRVHRGGPDSQARMELLDRMALAYSMAPHINPRTAFRYVYGCYNRQMRERLRPRSVSVAMANAFTRAGLIRPLQAGKWVSTTQVRWILNIVRSTQGTDVADRVDETVYKWRRVVALQARADQLAKREAQYFAVKRFTDYRRLNKALTKSTHPISLASINRISRRRRRYTRLKAQNSKLKTQTLDITR